ncbi:nicotinamide riboside kinase 2 isoform X3 [Hyla sarda]|nr:nicotinamide riboside kinase 2 isoform X3 [Hyla sarda]XP_056407972.1 nicotinamide riboside kinase 2 isoform X3 [Hyla sarda]
MEAMVNTVTAWVENPVKFARSHGIALSCSSELDDVQILILEGFLLYNHKSLADLCSERYYLSIPYEECKRRRRLVLCVCENKGTEVLQHLMYSPTCSSSLQHAAKFYGRNYTVPDPPGLFDGHVWPMYLKHRLEMEESGVSVVPIDGLLSKDEIFTKVYTDIHNRFLNAS